MRGSLALVQVVLDQLGLAQQKADVLVAGLEEVLDDEHGFLELLGELDVLLVAPGVAEAKQLTVQGRQPAVQLGREAFQTLRESAQLARVHNRLWHGKSFQKRDKSSLPGTAGPVKCQGRRTRSRGHSLPARSARAEADGQARENRTLAPVDPCFRSPQGVAWLPVGCRFV